MIPWRVREKMGEYDIVIDEGKPVKVKVIDNAEILNYLCRFQSWPTELVVGVDFKRITSSTKTSTSTSTPATASTSSSSSSDPSFYDLLIFYWENEAQTLAAFGDSARCCLIVHLHYMKNDSTVLKSLRSLLEVQHICFVRAPSFPVPPYCGELQSIPTSELAARILQNSDLFGLSLDGIASEVGVSYEDLNTSSLSQEGYIEVETNYVRVFTPEQVKRFVHDAYTCHRIAIQLFKPFM